jgi:hypothetical protein
MMRWLLLPALLLLLLALALGFVARPADAQDAQDARPSIFVDLSLSEREPGVYRLDVALQGGVIAYRVLARVQPIGSSQAVVLTLADTDDPNLNIDLSLPLDGMAPVRNECYTLTIEVAPRHQAQSGVIETDPLQTYACVEDDGSVRLPGIDSVRPSPPSPPSGVRVLRERTADGDTWAITWRPSATGYVIAYDPGILLFDRPWTYDTTDIISYGGIEMPVQPANWTSAGAINTFFVPTGAQMPDEQTCGYALVLVWAIGADGPSMLPANTTLPACFRAGHIDFPYVDAGGVVLPRAGEGNARHRAIRPLVAVALGAIGAAVVLAGAATARRR